jgi:hypothetical protein
MILKNKNTLTPGRHSPINLSLERAHFKQPFTQMSKTNEEMMMNDGDDAKDGRW